MVELPKPTATHVLDKLTSHYALTVLLWIRLPQLPADRGHQLTTGQASCSGLQLIPIPLATTEHPHSFWVHTEDCTTIHVFTLSYVIHALPLHSLRYEGLGAHGVRAISDLLKLVTGLQYLE